MLQSVLGASVLLFASVMQEPAVVVLDFDAGELTYVPDTPSDPDLRTTPFSECAGIWPPFGDAERARTIVEGVAELFADFNLLVVTDEPPCEGAPYVRVVIGPFEHCGVGAGYAENSCSRRIGHGIVYAKLGADDGKDLARSTALIAHEVGHAMGLAHVDDPEDIMFRTLGAGGTPFVNRCLPIDTLPGGQACQLIGWCPALDPRGQNSWFGLASLLGPAPPDGASTPGCAGDTTGGGESTSDASEDGGTDGTGAENGTEAAACSCQSTHVLPSTALLALVFGWGRRRSS
jgi:hypothetical protein